MFTLGTVKRTQAGGAGTLPFEILAKPGGSREINGF